MRLSTVIFLVLPITVHAGDSSQCASACQLVLSHIKFDGSSAPAPTDYYTSTCTNLLSVQSTYLCMRYYCSEPEIADGLASLDNTCRMDGIIDLFPWTIISNISNEQLLSWPHINYADLKVPVSHDTPVLVSESLFRLSLRTIVRAFWIFFPAY